MSPITQLLVALRTLRGRLGDLGDAREPALGSLGLAADLRCPRKLRPQLQRAARLDVLGHGCHRSGDQRGVHGGDAAPALNGSLMQGHRLDARYRDDREAQVEETVADREHGVGQAEGAALVHQRIQDPRAVRDRGHPAVLARADAKGLEEAVGILHPQVRDRHRDRLDDLRAAADGKQHVGGHIHLHALILFVRRVRRVAGLRDLHAIPAKQSPDQRLAHLDGVDASRRDRHVTASRQATVNAYAVGSDSRGEAELSIETRPDARQEAERARQDAQETHDRRHPDDPHEEAVEAQEEDAEEQGNRIVDGRQHGHQELDEADLENGALRGLQRGLCRRHAGRGTGQVRGIHDLVDRTRSEREEEGAQLLKAMRGQQAQLDARISAARDLNVQITQAQEATDERVGHVDRLDAREARVTLRALEDAGAVPDRRIAHRVASLRPRQVAVRTRDGEDDARNNQQTEEDAGGCEPRRHLTAQHALDRRRIPHGHHADDTHDASHHARKVGERVKRLPVLGGDTVRGEVRAHRPISSAEPRSAKTSRRRAASATGTPLSVASVFALAVDSLIVEMPSRRSTGPW